MRALFDAYLERRTGSTATTIRRSGKAILRIPDEELWRVRSALRMYLFTFIRERARQRWKVERVSAARVVAAGTLLDPATR